MKKTINFCGNCPFHFTIGCDVAICKLSKFEKLKDFNLDPNNLETPDWCLLRKGEYTLSFAGFSGEKIDKISDLNFEIKKLENEGFNKEDLKELYDELSKLSENEDLASFDISDHISDVRKELLDLEEAGERLKKMFMDMGNMDFKENKE